MVKRIVLWVLVISCMSTIFIFSHQSAEVSHDLSNTLLYKILDTVGVFNDMQKSARIEAAEFLHFLLRKLAHFSIYAFLGMLVYLLMRSGYEIKNALSLTFAPVVCVVYAISDEVHQLYIPGRSGEVRDVLIDTAGAAVGILITATVYILLQRRRKNG
ncbi:MAG: VanZ family protein [Clostridia bacterium]|nr:VanZ family protein [Clostridia bacterium]